MVEAISGLVTLVCAIWVGVDASRLGVRKGGLGGGFLDMGIAGWFFSVWLLFIIGFPLYLVTRSKYVARREQSLAAASRAQSLAPGAEWAPGQGAASWGAGHAHQAPPPQLPPAGWYQDPHGPPGSYRWWDGRQWGAVAPPPPPPPGS